jgi:hypothetical protein
LNLREATVRTRRVDTNGFSRGGLRSHEESETTKGQAGAKSSRVHL